MSAESTDLGFETWFRKVNRIIEATVGLSADDLSDQPWRDWYDDEMTPREAAKQALAEEGYEE